MDGDRAAIVREREPRPGRPLRCEDVVNPLNLPAREAVLDVQEQPHQRLGDPDRLVGRHRRMNRVRIDDVLMDERGIVEAERIGGQLLICLVVGRHPTSVAGTSRSSGSTSPAEELRRRRRARDRLPSGQLPRLTRKVMWVTLSASIAGPARVHYAIRFDMLMKFMGTWEARQHTSASVDRPLGHIPALSHPKELAERLQGHAAREGMSSG